MKTINKYGKRVWYTVLSLLMCLWYVAEMAGEAVEAIWRGGEADSEPWWPAG